MKTIEISDELYDQLLNISIEINSQDNRCTAEPFYYQIQTNENKLVPDGFGETVFVDEEGDICSEEDVIRRYIEYHEPDLEEDEVENKMVDFDFDSIYYDESALEKIGFRKHDVIKEHKYQHFFFTEKACEEHIQRNHYHYVEPKSYVCHAWRNPEMEAVYMFLKNLKPKDKE